MNNSFPSSDPTPEEVAANLLRGMDIDDEDVAAAARYARNGIPPGQVAARLALDRRLFETIARLKAQGFTINSAAMALANAKILGAARIEVVVDQIVSELGDRERAVAERAARRVKR